MRYVNRHLLRVKVIDKLLPDYKGDNALFNKHYADAIQKVDGKPLEDDVLDVVIKIMQASLQKYTTTQAKTDGGKVGRFLASVTEKILPLLRFIKLKK